MNPPMAAAAITGDVTDSGTSSLAHLEENMASAKIQLTQAEWAAIEELVKQA